MINFISKPYGGRSSDAYITNNSGFLDKLEPGDVILADKGFPEIQTDGVITVIPPRKRPGQKQFSVAQMATTKKIALNRIHVERMIQRMKQYKILSHTLDLKLLAHIHKILRVIALLANCQRHIIAPKATGEEEEETQSEATQGGGRAEGQEEEEAEKLARFWESMDMDDSPNLWDGVDEPVQLTEEEQGEIDRLVNGEQEENVDEEEEIAVEERRGKKRRIERGGTVENVEGKRRSTRLMNKRKQ